MTELLFNRVIGLNQLVLGQQIRKLVSSSFINTGYITNRSCNKKDNKLNMVHLCFNKI